MTNEQLLAWAADQRLTYPRGSKRGDIPRAVISLKGKLEDAQAWMREFGRHSSMCPLGDGIGYYTPRPDAECTCGLARLSQ